MSLDFRSLEFQERRAMSESSVTIVSAFSFSHVMMEIPFSPVEEPILHYTQKQWLLHSKF